MATEKTFRAITEVHITDEPGKRGDKAKGLPPVKPKVIIIPAKGYLTMDPDSDVAKELLAKGAIELAQEPNKADTPVKIGAAKAKATKTAPATTSTAKVTKPAKAASATKGASGEDAGSEGEDDGSGLV